MTFVKNYSLISPLLRASVSFIPIVHRLNHKIVTCLLMETNKTFGRVKSMGKACSKVS